MFYRPDLWCHAEPRGTKFSCSGAVTDVTSEGIVSVTVETYDGGHEVVMRSKYHKDVIVDRKALEMEGDEHVNRH